MMETEVDRELLEKIADMLGKPVGAFNIRKDCGCDGRQSTEHIKIDNRTDGKSGIDIRILDGTEGETCHIPTPSASARTPTSTIRKSTTARATARAARS